MHVKLAVYGNLSVRWFQYCTQLPWSATICYCNAVMHSCSLWARRHQYQQVMK